MAHRFAALSGEQVVPQYAINSSHAIYPIDLFAVGAASANVRNCYLIYRGVVLPRFSRNFGGNLGLEPKSFLIQFDAFYQICFE